MHQLNVPHVVDSSWEPLPLERSGWKLGWTEETRGAGRGKGGKIIVEK